VTMESQCSAAEAVVGNRVILRRRSSILRSILWDDVEAGEESALSECIATSGARIPPRGRFHRKILLDESTYGGDRKGLDRDGGLLLASF
jgi:NDP-sugar pyrophosphorylase family protein